MAARRWMVVERFRFGPEPVYARFREQGRLAPDGLDYISSWVSEDLTQCWQVMEEASPGLLEQWMARWEDLVEFQATPVLTSQEAEDRTRSGGRG